MKSSQYVILTEMSEANEVNLALTLFKSCIENKIIHVIELCKEKPLTRHLDRSVTERRDLIKPNAYDLEFHSRYT